MIFLRVIFFNSAKLLLPHPRDSELNQRHDHQGLKKFMIESSGLTVSEEIRVESVKNKSLEAQDG